MRDARPCSSVERFELAALNLLSVPLERMDYQVQMVCQVLLVRMDWMVHLVHLVLPDLMENLDYLERMA